MLDTDLDRLSEQFKVLGDKTRLRIIGLLKERELCVCDLTEVLKISQPGVSQHMRRLKQIGFVKERKEGQWVYYSLNRVHPFLEILPMIQPVVEDLECLARSKGCALGKEQ